MDQEGSEYNKVPETRKKLEDLGFKCTFECPEGKMYSYRKAGDKQEWIGNQISSVDYKVQLVCENFYSNPVELLQTFDLTPTLFCTDGQYLWIDKRGIKAVKKKICNLVALTYPVATINRLFKYRQKGYEINCAIQEVVSNLVGRTDILNSDSLRVYID